MSLSEPDAAFPADRNLTFLFARRPDGYVGIAGSAGRIRDAGGRPAFDLTPRAVASASFAKLLEPPG